MVHRQRIKFPFLEWNSHGKYRMMWDLYAKYTMMWDLDARIQTVCWEFWLRYQELGE